MSYVLSFSGGLDSTSLLLHLICKNKPVYAISFDYGQKHKIEIEFAKKNINLLESHGINVNHKIVNISSIVTLLESSLTDPDINVPNGHYMDTNMKSTFVPNRNAIFSSVIYAYAISIYKRTLKNTSICLGVHSGDHLIYPDCRPEYISSFEKTANLATKAGVSGSSFKIHTPLIDMTKSEIIKVGLDLGVDYSLTSSCYDPDQEGNPCGLCDACYLRLKGFKETGITDPLNYSNQ